jgi:hypothetical protein
MAKGRSAKRGSACQTRATAPQQRRQTTPEEESSESDEEEPQLAPLPIPPLPENMQRQLPSEQIYSKLRSPVVEQELRHCSNAYSNLGQLQELLNDHAEPSLVAASTTLTASGKSRHV